MTVLVRVSVSRKMESETDINYFKPAPILTSYLKTCYFKIFSFNVKIHFSGIYSSRSRSLYVCIKSCNLNTKLKENLIMTKLKVSSTLIKLISFNVMRL